MVARILLCLALLSSSGCAYMASRQVCNITSNPPGASLSLTSSLDEQTPGRRLGTTPYQKVIQQGAGTEYLRADLEGMVEPVTRGDPESPLRWTCLSLRRLTAALQGKGHQVSYQKVANILHELRYSLQATSKTWEGTGHADRDAQTLS